MGYPMDMEEKYYPTALPILETLWREWQMVLVRITQKQECLSIQEYGGRVNLLNETGVMPVKTYW